MEQGDAREPVTKEVRLLVPIEKGDSPQRVTYGVVLEPDSEDLQGDVMTAEDIEKAAYDWMERSQHGGHMHAALVEGAKVVESYIAPSDIPVETADGIQTIRKGSWVLAMRWPKDVWESIQKGELTGYSVGGTGVRLEIEKHGDHDQSSHGNWARGGACASDNEGGRYKKGDVVRFKEDGGVGRIVDFEPGKDGSPDEYAIAPEDLGEDGPKAIWVREDELADATDDELLDGYPAGTVDDEEMYPTGGKWRGEGGAEAEEAEWRAGYGRDASQGWEANAGYQTFTRGQKVRTPTGKIRTVHSQRGAQVFVEEESNGWYHPSKLWPVKKSAEGEALEDAVRGGLRDAVAKHGSHDQSTHGNWARGGKSGLEDGEEFVTGDRVRLLSNERIDWGGLEGATGRISEVTPGSLGWPTVYSVKLDREWVGFEDEDIVRDLEADRLTLLRRVRKHGSHDQSEHGNWARGRAEGDKKHTTRDGVVIEDQPKVQHIKNSEMFASADGRVQLNYGEWKWTGSGKQPKLHERGNWMVWPRGWKNRKDRDQLLIRGKAGGETLAELINRLPPGEYDLAT